MMAEAMLPLTILRMMDGGFFDADAERLGDFFANGLNGAILIEAHSAAVIILGIEVAEDDVGVGDSRLGAAEIETGGAGHRAGAARADLHAIFEQFVHAGDGAAAGADRESLDHGDADHPAVDDGAEIVAADAVLDDQADVEAGAAHVGHDDVLVAERLWHVMRAHQAGDWTAIESAAGGGAENFGDSAGALNHEQRFFVAALAQLVPHGGKLDLHGALQIGVEDGGHGALVFAELADDLSGENHRQVADVKFLVFVADDFFDAALVHRIQEAPEKRDDEAARAAIDEVANFFADIVFIERADDVAARIHALLYADDHVSRDERVGLFLDGEVAALGTRVPSIHCAPRPISTTSSWPSVVISAEARAFFSISRFSAMVVE